MANTQCSCRYVHGVKSISIQTLNTIASMRVRTRHEGIILLLWLEFIFFFAIARENDCAIVRRFCTKTRYLTVLIFVPSQNIFF